MPPRRTKAKKLLCSKSMKRPHRFTPSKFVKEYYLIIEHCYEKFDAEANTTMNFGTLSQVALSTLTQLVVIVHVEPKNDVSDYSIFTFRRNCDPLHLIYWARNKWEIQQGLWTTAEFTCQGTHFRTKNLHLWRNFKAGVQVCLRPNKKTIIPKWATPAIKLTQQHP